MRARHGLRPETFPFLAVLLCAMGSLILLLLVMDRRAKAVARARAASRAAAAEQGLAAGKAGWERRRQALHAELVRQDEEVAEQARAVRGRLDAAAAQA